MTIKKRQKIAIGIVVCIAALALFAGAGARINTSSSIAVGLYWQESGEPVKGSYVIFCPPRNDLFDEAFRRGYFPPGFCPGGYGYLMKKILAAKDDSVSLDETGVYVNGMMLPYSMPKKEDGGGNAMWRLAVKDYKLKDDELLLMTDVSPESFDARYFGLVQRNQVQGVVRPVLTW